MKCLKYIMHNQENNLIRRTSLWSFRSFPRSLPSYLYLLVSLYRPPQVHYANGDTLVVVVVGDGKGRREEEETLVSAR